nr:hypothetical protein [Tanacetum cinerariifolium]
MSGLVKHDLEVYEFEVWDGPRCNPNAYDWLKCVAHDPRDKINGYEAVWIEGTGLEARMLLEDLEGFRSCASHSQTGASQSRQGTDSYGRVGWS